MEPLIRAARVADIPAIQDLELDAGRRFLEIGMDAVADDPPPDAAHLSARIEAGAIWVATDPADNSVLGYAMASVVDDEGHLDQVSVALAQQGRGTGRLLVERVCGWAEDEGFEVVTLTTFRDVPWNGPLYAHLGFEPIPVGEIGPELSAIRSAEKLAGLDAEPRLAMRRRLPPTDDWQSDTDGLAPSYR